MSTLRKIYHGAKFWWVVTTIAYRFFAGRTLTGERKTDATFLHPATRSLDPSHRALRWEMQRGAARLAWRLAGLYVCLAAPAAMLAAWAAGVVAPGMFAEIHLAVFGLAAAVYVTRRGNADHGWKLPIPTRVTELTEDGEQEKEVSRWKWRWIGQEGRLSWEQEKIIPLARALSSQLNLPGLAANPSKARAMLTVPRNYREVGSVITVMLPDSFTGADVNAEKRLIGTVKARLGIKEELSASWQLEGSSPRVLLSLPPLPPSLVSFDEILPHLLTAKEFAPFVGVIAGGEGVTVSLKDDSPHLAVSAGSGAGKSVLIKNLAMQFRRWGWNLIILDWKEESHEWAKGMEGVRYCSSIESIHDMCVSLGEEVEARKAFPHSPRPKVLVVSEEWNITAPLLAEYWSTLRSTAEPEERRMMPLRSPALTGRMKVNFTGRQLGLCDILVAQRFSARVTNGNADLRESFQVLFMARWKSQTLKMLADGIKPFPRKPKNVGGWVVVSGDEAFTIQVPLVTDEEAQKFALGGLPASASPFIVRGVRSDTLPAAQTCTLGKPLRLDEAGRHEIDSEIDLELDDTEAEVLTDIDARKLAEMVDDLLQYRITYQILRNAARSDEKGDGAFPAAYGGTANTGYTYDFAEVREWARRRHARQRVEQGVK
jgi:hypothetical protein